MSHVDTSTNVHCANIHINDTILPIYWCLTEIKHEDTNEVIKRTDLLVGGGSGEHPALHIKNADFLPVWLANHNLNYSDEETVFINDKEVNSYDFLEKIFKDREIVTHYPSSYSNFMNISNWSIKSLSEIQKVVDKETAISSESEKKKISVAEEEFLASIATFILYEMPDNFFSEEVFEFVKDFRHSDASYVKKNLFYISYPLNHLKSGKTIKNERAIWGFSLADYLKGE
jgi:hypothetical protein